MDRMSAVGLRVTCAAAILALCMTDVSLSDHAIGVRSALAASTGVLEPSRVGQRTWTDSSGQHSRSGTIIAANDGWVLVDTGGGNRISVSIDQLSRECQLYVEEVMPHIPSEAPRTQSKAERLQHLSISPGAVSYAEAWAALIRCLGQSQSDMTDVAMFFAEGDEGVGALPRFNPDRPNPSRFTAMTVGKEGVDLRFIMGEHGQQNSQSYTDFFSDGFAPVYVATRIEMDRGTSTFIAADGVSSSLSVVKAKPSRVIGEEAEFETTLVEVTDPSGEPLRDITGLAFGEEGKLYVACSVGVVVFSENPLQAQSTLSPDFTPAGIAAHHNSGYIAVYSADGEVGILARAGDSWQVFSGPMSIQHIAFVAPKDVIVIRGDHRAAVARAE